MAGGLINIISYGLNDLYLTGAPQITLFKVVYRRHTNFSRESIILDIDNLNFGKEVDISIPKIGDLMKNIYLQLEIPSVRLRKNEIIADATPSEANAILTGIDTSIPLTSAQLSITSDYPTVINFMAVNTAGYRIAQDLKNIKNITTEAFVSKVLISLQYQNSLDSEYQAALTRAYTYETSVGNKKPLFILFYKNSDIKDILNTRIVELNAYSQYSVTDVFNMIESAINVSKEVQNYYFTKVMEKKNLDLEYSSPYAKFAWVERLGHAIVDKVDINIGGERIDRHYGDFINIWYELTSSSFQDELYNKLIGNVREMTTFDSNERPQYNVIIPLSFWFCKNAGLAFPLVALQYADISLSIKLKPIEQCAYIERLKQTIDGESVDIQEMSLSDIWENYGYVMNASLFVDYIYLDSLERKRFAQSAHEYLIETTDNLFIENITDKRQSITLDFNGPCKELIWVVQKTSYVSDSSNNNKLTFNYSYNSNKTGNPIKSSSLLFNGYSRYDFSYINYFNYLQPSSHHSRTPSDGINLYSFSLFPQEHQPSSCVNFSRISNPNFVMEIDTKMFTYQLSDIDPLIIAGSDDDEILPTAIDVRIYSIRYNVLRIIGGMAGFAYQYNV